MRRNRFLPFLILSLGAHLAILLLWRADRGGTGAPAPPLTVVLRSAGGSTGAAPARPVSGPMPAPLNDFLPRERIERPAESRSLPQQAPVPLSPSPTARQASTPVPMAAAPASSSASVSAAEDAGPVGEDGHGAPVAAGSPSPAGESGVASGVLAPYSQGAASPPLIRAEPDYASNPPPPYPRSAQERGWEGTVRLQVRVSAVGDVADLKVESSSGYPVLDRAALDAVRSWRFRPARFGDRPVEGTVLVPIAFTLRRS